jgi:O-antigen/teichoic acid export membrane protein
VSPAFSARARPPAGPLSAGVSGRAAELVTQALLIALVPRALGPDDYGDFAVVLSAATLASTSLSLGGPVLMARYLPAAPAGRRRGVARALALRVLRVRAVLLLGLAVAAALLSALDPDGAPATLTALALVAIVLEAAATLASDVALGLHEVRLWSFRYAIRNAALVIAALALHPLFGLNGAVAAVAIGAAAMLAVFVPGLVRELSGTAAPETIPPGALRFGRLQAIGGGLAQVAFQGPVIAVALASDAGREAARAALAMSVASAAMLGVAALFTAHLPGFAGMAAADPDAAEAELRALARRLQLPLLALALAVALLAEPVLELLVGARFGDLGPALAPAAAMVPLASASALGVQAAALRLRPEVRLTSTAAGAMTFVAVAAALVPTLEAQGAVCGALAAVLVTALTAVALLPGAIPARMLAESVGATVALLALGLAL